MKFFDDLMRLLRRDTRVRRVERRLDQMQAYSDATLRRVDRLTAHDRGPLEAYRRMNNVVRRR